MNHTISLSCLRLLAQAAVCALAVATGIAAHAQPAAGWTGEFTIRVESAGQRPAATAAAMKDVSGVEAWTHRHELRGTLVYTQRARGAVARNQPDRHNEQRYESWLARAQRVPVPLTLHATLDRRFSGRYILVDGEGAGAINRANAGKIGKVEHVRSRSEVRIDAADGARMGGAYLQIDRVANQIRFESPTIEINPARATVVEQQVARLDKAPAAGEWDRNETFTPKSAQDVRGLAQLPYPVEFVFDVPAETLAGARELTLTQAFKAPFLAEDEREASRGTITLVLRRGDAAAAAAASPATAAAGSAAAAPAAAAAAPARGDEAKKAETSAQPQSPAPATPSVQDAAKAVDRLRGLFGR
ncbi:MAG: hypothetical protein N2688_07490 [Burkholderiaceae bacterium]|nr:hypothetical protein [Burkholderiaceae bacterium]